MIICVTVTNISTEDSFIARKKIWKIPFKHSAYFWWNSIVFFAFCGKERERDVLIRQNNCFFFYSQIQCECIFQSNFHHCICWHVSSSYYSGKLCVINSFNFYHSFSSNIYHTRSIWWIKAIHTDKMKEQAYDFLVLMFNGCYPSHS